MARFAVYKTKKNSIFVIAGGTKGMVVFDGNIPPSKAKCIATFESDSTCDYIHNMIPILMDNLPNDTEVTKIYEEICRNGV